MKYLVLLTPAPGTTPEDFEPQTIAEVKTAWAAYASGRLREAYISPSPLIVTLIYELPDVAAVNDELDTLPMMRVGLLERQVVQLGPFLEWRALFDKGLMGAA